MGVICLLHRYSKISAVRIPPKGLRITLEIREFGYLIIFQLGIPLGGAFKRSYREPSTRSFDPLNSCTVIIHPKKTLCKDKNSPTAVAVGESMLGQIYRFTLISCKTGDGSVWLNIAHAEPSETTEKVVFLSCYSQVVTVKLYELEYQYPNS